MTTTATDGDITFDASTNTLTVDSSTNASSKDTGALIITAGGLGVEGNIHSGGDIVAFSSSDMTLKEDISPIAVSYTHLTLPTKA